MSMMDDDDVTPCLVCHVEMSLEAPSNAVLNKWCADALRKIADRIERDELEDGFHEVTDNVGKKIGECYMSYEGMIIYD